MLIGLRDRIPASSTYYPFGPVRMVGDGRVWQAYEGSRWKKMSATAYQQEEERIAAGGAPLTRTAEFEELYGELVEEAGRALEKEDLGWWVVLQEVLIPQIDAEIRSVSRGR